MSRETEPHIPDDDILAAEYVLGVQTSDLRDSLSKRILQDSTFASLIVQWEHRLSPMNEVYQPIAPPLGVRKALFLKLFSNTQRPKQSFSNSLTFWRGLSAVAFALCLFIIGASFVKPSLSLDSDPIIASLQADSGEVKFMAFYDPDSAEIRLTRVNSDKPIDKDYELWLIEADGVPQSIGIVSDAPSARVRLTADDVDKINAGDTFAISIEPVGGSPTGSVTGPVIAAGVSQAL